MKKINENLEFFNYSFFKKNRKGLSTIIIVLILVGLSLVAIGIIWGVVSDLLKSSSEQSTSQFGSLFLNLKIINVKNISGDVSVTIQRQAGEGDLEGIIFLFSAGDIIESVRKETNLEVFETEVFNFNLEKIDNLNLLEKVSIAPILSGGSEKDIIDTYIIKDLISGVGSGDEEDEEVFDCTISGCSGGWICQNRICVPPTLPQTCSSPADCPNFHNCVNSECVCVATCSDLGYSCGMQTVCGQSVNCGTCPFGQYCSSAGCLQDTIINSGIIDEVFPSEAKLYFSSSDLPPTTVLPYLGGKYVNFSSTSGCRQITYHRSISTPYNINYVELNSIVEELNSGTSYTIWNNTACGY